MVLSMFLHFKGKRSQPILISFFYHNLAFSDLFIFLPYAIGTLHSFFTILILSNKHLKQASYYWQEKKAFGSVLTL